MSGLCGFLHTGGIPASGAHALLAAMAAPLGRFDASPPRLLLADAAGVGLAVAASAGAADLHRQDGVLVALWGRPRLDGGGASVAARLAAQWRARGADICAALSGPFALAVVDSHAGQVLLATDRGGAHPMHYQSLAGGLIFGSSAAALRAHPQAGTELDPQSVYHYLYFHMVPAPLAIHRGQRRLLPGQYLLYSKGKIEQRAYWNMRYDETRRTPFPELRREFLATLDEAVRSAIVPEDGETGAFLSGGTDSSTLAGMLAKATGTPPRTYSIGFDVSGYDEMGYARIAARHFHTRHHERYVTADDVAAAIPLIAAVCDQPFGNASIVPAYYCARMARADGVTRLLGGDGGDELFGGNERYARQAVLARYERLPSALRQCLLEPLLFGLARGLDVGLLRKARSYVEQALAPMPARMENYNLLRRYGPGQVLEPDFLAAVDPGAPLRELSACYWETEDLSQINRMQTLDLRYTLADNDLIKVGRACELAGVEVAYPFLTDAMLAFSARLPPSGKLNGTRLRPFFKQALRDHLPREIVRKKKHGFGLPFGHWLRHHAGLRDLAFDSLGTLKARHIVRGDFIDTLMSRRLAEHPSYHGTMVWVLMMLELWLRQCQYPYPAAAAEPLARPLTEHVAEQL